MRKICRIIRTTDGVATVLSREDGAPLEGGYIIAPEFVDGLPIMGKDGLPTLWLWDLDNGPGGA